jgi:hypothetical protein
MRGVLALLAALAVSACSVGEGEGSIRSERLFIADCWDGPVNLRPSFFGANAFEQQDSMLIRVQRGGRELEVSDGIVVAVNDVTAIREDMLGQDLAIGLPAGVSPPGVPVRWVPDPPKVSLSLYLYESCHAQNSAAYAFDGWIRFSSLFSGDRNETNAADRLTDAEFEAYVADPREMDYDSLGNPSPNDGLGRASVVTGSFRFYFERGVPAQPFP